MQLQACVRAFTGGQFMLGMEALKSRSASLELKGSNKQSTAAVGLALALRWAKRLTEFYGQGA